LLNQLYFYFQTYKSDALWIRLFVVYLSVLETANTAIDMAMMYQPLIAGYGTEHAVQNFPTLFMTEPIIIVLVSTPIQLFFARRIYKVTKSYWVPLIIVVLSLASCVGGLITGVKIEILKLFIKKPELHWSALLWFLPSCVADLLITFTLVRSLSQRKTGFTTTDSMIDKLIRMTVQTGMVTAIFALGDVAFFLALPHTALNFVWDLTLSKLYTNCLLSTLNARSTLLNNSQTGSSGPFRDPESLSRRQNDFRFRNTQSGIMSAPQVYELDNTKTFQSSHGEDTGYGITVTKIVERLEDPIAIAQ